MWARKRTSQRATIAGLLAVISSKRGPHRRLLRCGPPTWRDPNYSDKLWWGAPSLGARHGRERRSGVADVLGIVLGGVDPGVDDRVRSRHGKSTPKLPLGPVRCAILGGGGVTTLWIEFRDVELGGPIALPTPPEGHTPPCPQRGYSMRNQLGSRGQLSEGSVVVWHTNGHQANKSTIKCKC